MKHISSYQMAALLLGMQQWVEVAIETHNLGSGSQSASPEKPQLPPMLTRHARMQNSWKMPTF